MLTPDRLRECIEYDPDTGVFTWLDPPQRNAIGDKAGFSGAVGYRQIRIDGTVYYEHRLAFLYVTGSWPVRVVDHIDGNRSNNCWSNIRSATVSQNSANTKKKPRTSSTLKGVSWMASKSKWAAHVRVNGKSTYLGLYDTEQDAHAAYCAAATETFGPFARTS